MKVLIATGIYPPDIGGMATIMHELALRFRKQGVDVSVVTYGKSNRKYQDGDSPALAIDRNSGLLSRYWNYFRAAYSLGKDADIIYGQDLVSSGLPSSVAAMLLGKAFVLRLGGDFLWEKHARAGSRVPLQSFYEQPKNLKDRIYLLVYKFVLGRASQIIFNSRFQAELYEKVFLHGRKPVSVIPNPFSEPFKARGLPDSKAPVVYAGRFGHHKNLARLISVYSKLETNRPLLLIGEGREQPEYEALIKSLNAGDRIKLLPTVSHGELLDILRKAYLVVIPTLTEINPNLGVEALSCGTPVLITKHNGFAKELRSKLMEFDPLDEDDIQSVLQQTLDSKNYQEYVKRLEQTDYHWTWDDVEQEHLNIFKNIHAHT